MSVEVSGVQLGKHNFCKPRIRHKSVDRSIRLADVSVGEKKRLLREFCGSPRRFRPRGARPQSARVPPYRTSPAGCARRGERRPTRSRAAGEAAPELRIANRCQTDYLFAALPAGQKTSPTAPKTRILRRSSDSRYHKFCGGGRKRGRRDWALTPSNSAYLRNLRACVAYLSAVRC